MTQGTRDKVQGQGWTDKRHREQGNKEQVKKTRGQGNKGTKEQEKGPSEQRNKGTRRHRDHTKPTWALFV